MIDFHCHLDLYPDPTRIVDECSRLGIHVVSVTTTPSAWEGTLALARDVRTIQTALGLHPEIAHERQHELSLFDELLPHVQYVGEIGLDGSPSLRKHQQTQMTVFDHILKSCSRAGGRVLSIHSRRATSAVLDTISAHSEAGTFVLHWFSGTKHELTRAVELGCWFSIGPAMLRTKKGRALTALMPPDRVLTESDGPFAQLDGVPVEPKDIHLATVELPELWALPSETVDHLLSDGFDRLCTTQGSYSDTS